MTFFYMLLAFIVGLLLGWFLWGRLRGELGGLQSSLESTRSERDRLKVDTNRLSGELEACGIARADLERKIREIGTKSSAAALISAPVAATSRASVTPKTTSTSTPAKSAVTAKTTKASKAGAADNRVAKPKPANSSKKDSLRRLIGIGPVNERRLNQHGITTYAQIAAWTAADIKRVEEYLEFDGRIEREKWVQQAQLLAAGKEKEFARRFPTAESSSNT